MTGRKILVVEDELIIGEHVRVSLEILGYQVGEVLSSGKQALQAAEAERPRLVLMDIGLKGEMDGVETARRIQESLDIPVVYLTAGSDPDTFRRASATEPFGYIIKPFQKEHLAATVEMALHKHGLEKRLRESEERYRSVFETVAASIAMTDRDGYVLDISPHHVATIGRGQIPREDYLGIKIAEHSSIVAAGMSEAYLGVLEGEALDRTNVHFPSTTGGGRTLHECEGSTPCARG